MSGNSLQIKNCDLIDGCTDSIQVNVDILIIDGKIEKIGKNLSISGEIKTIDMSGKTVLPGMIDTHVHLAFDGSVDPVGALMSEDDHLTLIKMVNNCHKQLNCGVTTVRDMGGPRELILELRESWHKNILVGPRMLVSGAVITSKGGHCHFIGHEVSCKKTANIVAMDEISAGVDLIKIMATGGSLTPGSSVHITQFTTGEIETIVQKAHQHNIKVAAHANAIEGVRNAIKAKVDSIEHASFADDQSLEAMERAGIWLVPTMSPAEILIESEHITEQRRNEVEINWKSRRKVVERAIKLGIKMASGTDAGTTLVPHGCIAREINLFHKLGMNPMSAIWTATRWAAELVGISDEVGSLTEGKVADLIAVSGNPIKDLRLLANPEMVIVAGYIIRNCFSLL